MDTEIVTTNLTTGEAAAAGAIFGGMMGVFIVFILAFVILTIIADWKIFEKAGEKGWKSLIPIYNVYIMFKIVDMKAWFWGLLAVSLITYIISAANNSAGLYYMSSTELQAVTVVPTIVVVAMVIQTICAIVADIVYSWRLSKVFGHNIGYCLGLIFLPNIFWLILAFGKSKYNKKALKA